jgi:protein-S-isoprenylcysteine O-methyltransferase Ste14
MSGAWLAIRSIFWAMVLPGTFALYVPWRFFGRGNYVLDARSAVSWVGAVVFALGLALLIACIVEFALRGRGTLSPADPTEELVVTGLYRYVRNPMYVGVSLIALGQAVVARSTDLAIYWAVFISIAHVFVVTYEEPTMRRMFSASYERYSSAVPRWIPRLTPWSPGS